MNIFTELQQDALEARKRWLGLQSRVMGYMSHLLFDFREFCGIPADVIAFLKWDGNVLDGEQRVYKLLDNGEYTLPGAIVFDQTDGYWRLGVRVHLTTNEFPQRYFFFILALTEREGAVFAKWPDGGDERRLEVDNQEQCRLFFDAIVCATRRSFNIDPWRHNDSHGDSVGHRSLVRASLGVELGTKSS